MSLDHLFTELGKLSRADKLRAMQFLVNELAAEESLLIAGAEYPIYTPFNNEAAAQTLWDALNRNNCS